MSRRDRPIASRTLGCTQRKTPRADALAKAPTKATTLPWYVLRWAGLAEQLELLAELAELAELAAAVAEEAPRWRKLRGG